MLGEEPAAEAAPPMPSDRTNVQASSAWEEDFSATMQVSADTPGCAGCRPGQTAARELGADCRLRLGRRCPKSGQGGRRSQNHARAHRNASPLADSLAAKVPALTKFQVEQIQNGLAERLRLQHYVILERIGAGGMGEVFLARNLKLPRLEAIKTILNSGQPGSMDSGLTVGVEHFQREIEALTELNHRCLTTIHHADTYEGVVFLAMEYVSGRDLKRVVEDAKAKGEQVPVWWAVQRIMAAADGLGDAHWRGYIHRDVKPNNIMITDDDQVKVLDLGLAKVVTPDLGKDSRLTQMAMGLGTPSVMPPEQWADAAAVTPASDIYSLGCTFFYLLTGQMPFQASNMRELMYCHMSEPPPLRGQPASGCSAGAGCGYREDARQEAGGPLPEHS